MEKQVVTFYRKPLLREVYALVDEIGVSLQGVVCLKKIRKNTGLIGFPPMAKLTFNPENLQYVFIRSELGAGTYGASLGPEAVRLYAAREGNDCFSRYPLETIDFANAGIQSEITTPNARRVDYILDVYYNVSSRISRLVKQGKFPFILSGDHSSAGAIIAGLRDAFPDLKLGVVWVDAHADLHTPYTSPSGNMHGMPLGAALGLTSETTCNNTVDPLARRRWEEIINLKGIKPKVRPEDLCFIGIRSLEQPEWDYIHNQNIHYFAPQQIAQQGIEQVAQATLEQFADYDAVYLSFDTDSLDARLVPGTGTPEPDGLSVAQAKQLLDILLANLPLPALEFTEMNPMLDQQNQTTSTIFGLIDHALCTLG